MTTNERDEQTIEPLVEEQARGGTTEDKTIPAAQQDAQQQRPGDEAGIAQRLVAEQEGGTTEDKSR